MHMTRLAVLWFFGDMGGVHGKDEGGVCGSICDPVRSNVACSSFKTCPHDEVEEVDEMKQKFRKLAARARGESLGSGNPQPHCVSML